jgi:hypothetical protein
MSSNDETPVESKSEDLRKGRFLRVQSKGKYFGDALRTTAGIVNLIIDVFVGLVCNLLPVMRTHIRPSHLGFALRDAICVDLIMVT